MARKQHKFVLTAIAKVGTGIATETTATSDSSILLIALADAIHQSKKNPFSRIEIKSATGVDVAVYA